MLVAEQELVALVRLGLSDSRIMGCGEHGFKKLSAVELRGDVAGAVTRMAARMSRVDFAVGFFKICRFFAKRMQCLFCLWSCGIVC